MAANYSTIEQALEELRAGHLIMVIDDPDRENEGDLIVAAATVTPEDINFMCRVWMSMPPASAKSWKIRS